MRRGRRIAEKGLGDLVRASRARDEAEARFHREILFAYEAGSSLRAIGIAIGMPHETVRGIVLKQRAKRDAAAATLARPIAALSHTGRQPFEAHRRKLAKTWRLSVQEMDT